MAETPRRNRPFIAVALACVVIAFAVVLWAIAGGMHNAAN